MTNKEAIMNLKKIIEKHYFPHNKEDWDSKERTALAIAIEILEKEEPKIPKIIYENGCNNGFCPTCKKGLGMADVFHNGRNHCPYCGQMLDWE